jgi:hypothetical protein
MGEIACACLFVLDEPKDEVAFLEGATADAATMVAAEALLVNGCPGECEVSCLVDEVDVVLPSMLVLFFDIVGDSW